MKKFFISAAIGALLGSALLTWVGPKLIGWWFQPPVAVPVDCTDALRWSMNRLIKFQLMGIGGGFVLGPIFAFVFGRKKPTHYA